MEKRRRLKLKKNIKIIIQLILNALIYLAITILQGYLNNSYIINISLVLWLLLAINTVAIYMEIIRK